MHQSRRSLRAARRSITALVPWCAGPSSSLVIRKATEPLWSGSSCTKRSDATSIAARLPFMSAAPRPQSMRWSSISASNGSFCQACTGPVGTTSVGPAKHRAVVLAVGGPVVVPVLDAHRLKLETGVAQALHHQLLAIGVDRRHRGAADQVDGKMKGRRKVGMGRHGGNSGAFIGEQARHTKRPLSYSKTAARGRRLVHCASFYSAVAGSAFGAGLGSDDRNAMINAATYGSDCTSSITTQKRMSALGRPCTR